MLTVEENHGKGGVNIVDKNLKLVIREEQGMYILKRVLAMLVSEIILFGRSVHRVSFMGVDL